jgi:hypothetical protein
MGRNDGRYSIFQVHFPHASDQRPLRALFLYDEGSCTAAQGVLDAVNEDTAPQRALREAITAWQDRMTREHPGEQLTWPLFFATSSAELHANNLRLLPDDAEVTSIDLGASPTQFGKTGTSQLSFGF